MAKLLSMVIKNFRLIIRSRVSAMVTIFGPLVITLLVGLAFNNASTYNIKIGLFSAESNELVASFVEKINEADFRVSELGSEQECIDNVRQGIVNICMVFPEGFDIASDEQTNVNNEIKFFVDPSKINLVYSVIDMISARVATRTHEISSELTTIILTTLDESKATINRQEKGFGELVTSTQDMKTKQSGIKQTLGKMELEVDTDDFGIDTLKIVNKSLSKDISGENSTLRRSINESLELMEEILEDIEASTLNGSSTHGDISDLEDQLYDIEDDIKDLDSDSLQDLSDTIASIETRVITIQDQMQKARDSRTMITREISDISTKLDQNIAKLDQIKENLNGVVADIESIEITKAESIVSPIKTKIEPVVSETYLNYMYPGLVMLVIMLVALLFSSTIIMMEKGSKAYFRNLVVPNPDWLHLLAAIISTLVLLSLQLALTLGLSHFVFQVDIWTNIGPTLLVLLLSVLLFTVIGILIGISFTSAETATLGAISIGSLSLFLSDIILPLESMPPYLIDIARFNPFVLGEYLLRRSLLFKMSIPVVAQEGYFVTTLSPLYILLLYIGAFTLIMLIVNMISRKHLVNRYMKKLAPKHLVRQEIDIAGKSVDSSEKTEHLIEEAIHMVDIGDYKRASQLYLHITEVYAGLPKSQKKEYFKRIVELQDKLRAAGKQG